MVTNWREVDAARREGRQADARSHYFDRGDLVALSPEYIERFPSVKKAMRPSGRDVLPAIEPVELQEQRLAVEAKLAEASQAAGAERAEIENQRAAMQDDLQERLDRYAGATILDEFTPSP